jgi:hypothetical protein
MKNVVFCDVAPCRSFVNRIFEEYIASYSHLLTLVPRSRSFPPWRWRRYINPKRQFTQDLHGATSQKTTFFIVTAVKTSNLTQLYDCLENGGASIFHKYMGLHGLSQRYIYSLYIYKICWLRQIPLKRREYRWIIQNCQKVIIINSARPVVNYENRATWYSYIFCGSQLLLSSFLSVYDNAAPTAEYMSPKETFTLCL